MTDFRHDPRLEPPNWPRLTISIDATTGTVALAGSSSAVSGATLDDTRLQAIDVAVAHAARIGRPLHAEAQDPDGRWPLIVHPGGDVKDHSGSDHHDRLLVRLLVLTTLIAAVSAAWVGALLTTRA